MGIRRCYPQWFEDVWEAYPDYPRGRSNKWKSWLAITTVMDADGWDVSDIPDLITEIHKWRDHAQNWQRHSEFGPPALQRFINERWYENDVKVEYKPQRKLDRFDLANLEHDKRYGAIQ